MEKDSYVKESCRSKGEKKILSGKETSSYQKQ